MKHAAQHPEGRAADALKADTVVNTHMVITRASAKATKLGREKS